MVTKYENNALTLVIEKADEASFAAPACTLDAIEAGDDVLNLYFGRHATKHKVAIALDDGKSDVVANQLIADLAPYMYSNDRVGRSLGLIKLFDEVASTYMGGAIPTAFGTIGTITISVDEG